MTEAEFDFDGEIDRRQVPALKAHRLVLDADGEHLFIADLSSCSIATDRVSAPEHSNALPNRMICYIIHIPAVFIRIVA